MNNDYIPVDCDFHDQLEALATLRRDCEIEYCDRSGHTITKHSRIIDVYAASHADWCKLQDGTEIRLDWIKKLSA